MRPITRTPSPPPGTDLTLGSRNDEAGPSSAGTSATRPRPSSPIPEALARRPPPRQIPAHDKQLAGYVMGRAIVGRPIEGEALDRLRQANDVLQQTREAMPIGRGNVTTDIEATNGHSYRTYSAARVVRNSRKLNALPVHRAAFAEIAGAGNCGEHAAVAVHKLAAGMAEGQEVHSVVNRQADHGWAELRTPAAPREAPTIVVDGWGEGPAIHAEDGVFTSESVPAAQRACDYWYDAQTAPPALEAKAAFIAGHADELGARIATLRTGMAALKLKQRKTFGPTPIIDAGFADRVAEKMAQVDDMVLFHSNLPAQVNTDLRNDLLATSVLRQMGASVRDATAAAPEVSASAGALRRAPQNPPRAQAAERRAHAAALEQSVQQTLLALFPSSPSDTAEEATPSSGGRPRDPDEDAGHDGRRVRQRV